MDGVHSAFPTYGTGKIGGYLISGGCCRFRLVVPHIIDDPALEPEACTKRESERVDQECIRYVGVSHSDFFPFLFWGSKPLWLVLPATLFCFVLRGPPFSWF